MGTASIWRLLFRFSGPAIVAMMVASSYNLVDAIFVGRLGAEALAALTVAFPLMMVFMAIGGATGMGAASLISRRLGAGDREGADRGASVTITLAILLGALMTVISLRRDGRAPSPSGRVHVGVVTAGNGDPLRAASTGCVGFTVSGASTPISRLAMALTMG